MQTNTMASIADQLLVAVFGFPSKVAGAKEEAAVAAEPDTEQEGAARSSAESFSEKSWRGCKSLKTRHRTCIRTCRNITNKFNESDLTV